MKTIEELYGAFGQDVIAEVRACMQTNGDLSPILARLNLPHSSLLTSQHEALRAFLYQYGIALFLRIMRSGMTPQEVETAKSELLLSRLVGDTRARTLPRGHQPANSHLHEQTQPRAESPSGEVAPAAESVASTGAGAKDERPIIVTPTYVGPDRRSGKDRRRNIADRRMKVELIFQNRRFGGRDRRRFKRRAEDRKKP